MKKAVIIPAVKKNVAFQDDLVKKLAGESLIQRAIDKAIEIVGKDNIYVVTDSEEICLLSQRKGVCYFYEKSLNLQQAAFIENLIDFLFTLSDKFKTFILLSPYAPLLSSEEIKKALLEFESKGEKLLIPVKRQYARVFTKDHKNVQEVLSGEEERTFLIESQAFQIIDSSVIRNEKLRSALKPYIYELSCDLFDIKGYQDWWVCEKLLKRKRIVIRVIGDEEVGMGHLQRALTLAHEMSDHEIRFVCDEKSKVATDKLAGYDYWLGIYKPDEIEDAIVALKPDLVINDILDSGHDYIRKLRDNHIPVINFEDLGEGAKLANLTINELYDEPLIPGENFKWGKDYFFVREEFNDACPNHFKESVTSVLIMFGGTDPSDYTRKILRIIKNDCRMRNIKIYVITGGGYPYIEELEQEIAQCTDQEIEYHHSIGVVSHIMEKVQVAISANGRTTYELAHMNIPAIVLSHHERENTHKFTREENGHVPLGICDDFEAEKKVITAFRQLIDNVEYRKKFHDRLKKFQFTKNKDKVISLIHSIIER